MRYSLGVFLSAGVLVLSPCAWAADDADAFIKGTTPDSKVTGLVSFNEEDGGLSVEANLANLTPGKHGFHIHENGSCADAGKAALKIFLPGVTLKKEGKYALLGKSVIVHDKEDDFSQPTGNAGARVGCGIIEEIPQIVGR